MRIDPIDPIDLMQKKTVKSLAALKYRAYLYPDDESTPGSFSPTFISHIL